MSSVYSKFINMNFTTNGFEDTRFKNLMTVQACDHKIVNCTQQALDLFRNWMKITDPDNNNM